MMPGDVAQHVMLCLLARAYLLLVENAASGSSVCYVCDMCWIAFVAVVCACCEHFLR
jgi:hypothetical protein